MSDTCLPVSTTAPRPAILEKWTQPALILLFCLLWSSAFTAAKIGIVDAPPLLLLGFRFLIAGVALTAVMLVLRGPQSIRRDEIGRLVLLGLLNHALYLGLGYLGMRTISSGLAAVIMSTSPIITTALAAMMLGERFTLRKGLGLLLGLAGVAFILRSRLTVGHDDLGGMLFGICAAIGLSAGTILYKKLPTRSDSFAGLGVQLIAAGSGLLPIALLLEDVSAIHPTWSLLGALLYLVGPISVGAYTLWFMLLRRGSATQASSLHFIMPPLGLLMGWAVLAEPLNAIDFLGILPVAFGIWLVTRSPKTA